MKFLIIPLTLGFMNLAIGASENTQVKNRQLIEESVFKLRAIEKLEADSSHDQSSLMSAKSDSELWSAITEAHRFMQNHNILGRHNFLKGAVEASAIENFEARSRELTRWLGVENKKLLQTLYTPALKDQWKALTHNILQNIARMNDRTIASTSSGVNIVADLQNVIRKLETVDLSGLQVATELPMVESVPAPVTKDYTSLLYTFFGTSLFFSLLFYADKKRTRVTAPKAVEQKAAETTETFQRIQRPNATLDLEQTCEKILDDNRYLLEVSKVKVLGRPRSPFNTTVVAPAETVVESLQGFLQGTLAIVKTSAKPVSHLEWTCVEQEGRLSVEFTVHGLECDTHSLYLNSLAEGASSAPAHFGRAERSLSSNLASVSIQKSTDKTTLRLGLDSSISSMIN